MKATIVDLRYKMNDVLKALKRNETVHVYYHGKECGLIVPTDSSKQLMKSVKEHPLFGSFKRKKPVEEIMEELRGGRYRSKKNSSDSH